MTLAVTNVPTQVLTDAGGSTTNISFSSLPAVGSAVHCWYSGDGLGGSGNPTGDPTINDNQGHGNYTKADSGTDAANGQRAGLYYLAKITASSGTFTVTYTHTGGTGTYYSLIDIAEITTAGGGIAIDQHTTGTITTGTPLTATTGTTTVANEVVTAAMTVDGSNVNQGIGTGLSGGTQVMVSQNDSAHNAGAGDYHVVSSTSTQTMSYAITAGHTDAVGAIATFSEVATASAVAYGPFQVHGVGQGPIARKRFSQVQPDPTGFPPAPPDNTQPTLTTGRIHPAGGGPTRRRIGQQYPDVTAFPVPEVFNYPQPPARKGRGPAFQGPGGRMFPQRFADTVAAAAPINATIGAWTWAGLAAAIAVSISATVGQWTWSGKTSPLEAQVVSKVGTWTWSGNASPLAASVSAKIGQWNWSGSASPLETSIRAAVGQWTWAGQSSALAKQVVSGIGQWTWQGLASPIGGPTVVPALIGQWTWSGLQALIPSSAPPTPEPGGGGGGPTQIPWPEWIKRYPWLLDVPMRPNWYAYPDQPKAIKAVLIKVAKKKQKIERSMQFAKGQDAIQKQLSALNEVQEVLAVLTERYRTALNLLQARVDAEEEQEFMELLQELL